VPSKIYRELIQQTAQKLLLKKKFKWMSKKNYWHSQLKLKEYLLL